MTYGLRVTIATECMKMCEDLKNKVEKYTPKSIYIHVYTYISKYIRKYTYVHARVHICVYKFVPYDE